MTNMLFTCTTCNNIFRNRSELNYHVKRHHQLNVKVTFRNGDVLEVKRAEDDTFKCKCEKSFQYPDSLRRHGKNCNGELAESKEDKEDIILMDMDDSDAPESLNADNRVIPTDC